MSDKEIIENGLADMYAMGLASPEEILLVEQAMAESELLRNEVAAIRKAMAEFGGASVEPMVPDERLKDKILADFRSDFAEQSKSVAPVTSLHKRESDNDIVQLSASQNKFYRNAAAAAVVALLGSAVLHFVQYRNNEELQQTLTATNVELAEQKNSSEQMQRDLQVLYNQNSQLISLAGTASYPQAAARVFWVKNTGEVYVDPNSLPAAPTGKQYQLWAIVDGKPQDAGILAKEPLGYRMQRMKSFGQVQAFAITLEKEGGSPTPTLEQMYVIGTL